tara:strand:+ start:726 stop:1571 length:846 start_codon:yes stop_codon:yes gene_type:complete
MEDIKKYINETLSFQSFGLKNSKDFNFTKNYYENATADAVHCYESIKKFLKKDKDILEIGGGIHLLTSFLNQEYKITSIEPGGFTGFTDGIRNQIMNKNKLNIHTTTLEEFKSDKKFDFIFSMNVLEHTKDIINHLNCCVKLLKNDNSIIFIQCPNYTFPFEPHFYEFFLPFFPNFTFKKIKRQKLIKKFGEKNYESILENLNFNCTYSNIKNENFKIQFINPLKDIFDRILVDKKFKERILSNFFVKITYKFIRLLKLEKFLCKIFPNFISPYMIFIIKK